MHPANAPQRFVTLSGRRTSRKAPHPSNAHGPMDSSPSGKSTLSKLLTAELLPSAGKVIVNGLTTSKLRQRQIPKLRRTLGVIFPPFVTILLIAYCLTNFFNTPAMINVVKGIRAGVCALILLSAIQLGKKILKGPFEITMAVIGFLSLLVFNFNVILMIILAGVAGLVYKAVMAQKKIHY